jgi:hypothetical protein
MKKLTGQFHKMYLVFLNICEQLMTYPLLPVALSNYYTVF